VKWEDVRQLCPNRWVLVEAIEVYTNDERCIWENVGLIEQFEEWSTAWEVYEALHRKQPEREMFLFHTRQPVLEITVLRNTGYWHSFKYRKTGRKIKKLGNL